MVSKCALQRKYETACALADQLYQKLQEREATLIRGKALVDQLMGVVEENERLKAENARLWAIVEGTEPPAGVEIT